MSKIPKYETKFSRLVLATLIGSVLGGFISVLPFAAASFPTGIGPFIYMVAYASTKWLWGILIFGMPIWFLLHKTGWREWYVAVSIGAVIPVLRLMILTSIFSNHRDFASVIKIAIMFAPIGIIISLVIWLIAYRRIDMAEKPNLTDKP